MQPLIAGNWKMNGLGAQLSVIEALAAQVLADAPAVDVLLCVPATLLWRAVQSAAARIVIGAEDCSAEVAGAHTGDISAAMLKDAGAALVIVGHSERRQHHGETDALVASKAKAAWRGGLKSIICIEETASQRKDGAALSICEAQIKGSVPSEMPLIGNAVAYEPLWAIGTGNVPTSQHIEEMHQHIRRCLVTRLGTQAAGIRILYGGSVKPANAREILALDEVGGALVGGQVSRLQSLEKIQALETRGFDHGEFT